jgi:SAM-dependent methyltransferase
VGENLERGPRLDAPRPRRLHGSPRATDSPSPKGTPVTLNEIHLKKRACKNPDLAKKTPTNMIQNHKNDFPINHITRLESEKAFHNECTLDELRTGQYKYYIAVKHARKKFSDLIAYHSRNKDVLEVGCFQGLAAVEYSKEARSYTGIDISDKAIDKARELNLTNCNFYVRDACDTGFTNGSYDGIIACSVIHHLPIEKSLIEMRRLLKPGGVAILFEPLGENPLINLYRKLTPGARTPDETPLVRADIVTIKRIFPSVSIDYFGLTTLICVPLRNSRRMLNIIFPVLCFIDRVLFLTPIKYWAWVIVVEARNDS